MVYNIIKNWPHYPILFLLIISKIYWTPNLSWWIITLPLWYWIVVMILIAIYIFIMIVIKEGGITPIIKEFLGK